MAKSLPLARVLARRLRAAGVARIFGMPGGGGNLDIIEAVRGEGIDFVLARAETAAAIMGAVTGELTATPGVVLTTKGPGLASAINGIAYAALDRAPLIVLSDGHEPAERIAASHQILDQRALSAPLVKAHATLEGADPMAELERLISLTVAPPAGPVHVELNATTAAREVTGDQPAPSPAGVAPAAEAAIEAARRLVGGARRPVVLAGLEARRAAVAGRLGGLIDRWRCPALTSYKAIGVIAGDHPGFVGPFTGTAIEAATIDKADLIVAVGFDPVELIPPNWRYRAPVVEIAERAYTPNPITAAVGVYGEIAATLDQLADVRAGGGWGDQEIAGLVRDYRAALAVSGDGRPSAFEVVRAVRAAAPAGSRATVDAGAHMFAATAFWPARAPHDLLISNGLSTMGFALPAAIAATLHEPDRPTVAFTGDGGLMMCLGELATLAERRLPVTVIVFNDAALSLIDIKQRARGFASTGVTYPPVDFAALAEGLGIAAYRAGNLNELGEAAGAAFGADMPALIDVRIDAAGYAGQLRAVRG